MPLNIDSIKGQNPLEDVIGARIELKKNGNEFVACCPFHSENTPSFTVNPDKGFFHCFGCGEHGDAIDFVTKYEGVSFKDACGILGGEIETNGSAPVKKSAKKSVDYYSDFTPAKVPERELIEANKPLSVWNPKRQIDGKVPSVTYTPSMVFPYYKADGSLLGYVIRQNLKDGKKLTPTLRWCKSPTGQAGWSHYPFEKNSPLYNLSLLKETENLEKPVLWVEGEKCADAATVLKNYVAVANVGGTNGIKKTDFSPLQGRRILIWCDNDDVGREAAMKKLVPLLWSVGVEGIKIIEGDSEKGKGWDIADAVTEGMTSKQLILWAKERVKRVEREVKVEPVAKADKPVAKVEQPLPAIIKNVHEYHGSDDGTDVLNALVQQYVYVRSEDKYYQIAKPDIGINKGAFNSTFCQRPDFDDRMPPVSKLYHIDPRRIHVEKRGFCPENFHIIDDVLNTYRPPNHPKPTGDIKPFKDFLKHLLPDDEEREWFVKWLAYKSQNLEKRGVGVVFVAPLHGTGRGTLLTILGKMFGSRQVRSVSMATVAGTGSQSQYNEWLSETLFAMVEETSDIGTYAAKSASYETLKELVDPSATEMMINRKGIQNSYESVYTSMIFATNHLDALAIPKEDRRFSVLENGDVLSENQADRVHKWYKVGENVSAALDWLMKMNTKNFNFGKSLSTNAKLDMISSSKSDIDMAVEEAAVTMIGEFFTPYQLRKHIMLHARNNDLHLPEEEKLAGVLKSLVPKSFKKVSKRNRGKISIDGRTYTIYSLNGKTFKGDEMDTDAVREEVRRNGELRNIGY